MDKRLPLARSVNLCRLNHVLGYRLKPGDVYNHHITDLLPTHKYYESPETVFCFENNGRTVLYEYAVKYHTPDISENDTAYEVRHKENRPKYIGAFYSLRQHICDRKRENIYQNKRNYRKQRRIRKCVHKRFVCNSLLIIFDTNKRPSARNYEFTEGQKQSFCEGIKKSYTKS